MVIVDVSLWGVFELDVTGDIKALALEGRIEGVRNKSSLFELSQPSI
jgi:hypothetical protein